MASTKITRTPSSVGNSKTWTYSMWIKLGNIGTEYVLFHNYGSSNTSEVYAKIGGSSGVIEFALRYSGTYEGRLITNRLFRDPNAWYHLVFACDTTSGTATNRQRIYVNGVEETSFSTDTQIAQDAGTVFNQAYEHTIGSYGSGNYFDGEMAHVHMIDGTAYPASTFGEFDSTSGIWTPKTAPSVTYGTNGFFLKFENSANLDLDSSGNNLTFATTGTLTQDTDTPTNNACTLNGVSNEASGFTLANNNTSATFGSSNWETIQGTLGVNKGKWYYETKWNGTGSYMVGWTSVDFMNQSPTNYVGHTYTYPSYAIQAGDGGVYYSTSSSHSQDSASWGNTWTSSDIIGCAIDVDNGKLYWSKNGTWMNSGVPTSGSTGTGAFNIADTATNYFWNPVMSSYNGAQGMFNFGSGYFGTTQVSSANADANGHGAFEYAVPSGYYALNTKNLKEFG